MKVLILDSREEDRHTLAGIVASRGHTVVSSSSGGDALREISAGGFDLVFCGEDRNGPGAPAFIRALRKLPGMISTPCYAAVRKGCEPEDERLLFDVGVTGVVEKPYDPRTILKVLEDSTGDSGQLALPRVSPGAMGDDTFVERYAERLVDTLERKIRLLLHDGRPHGEAEVPVPPSGRGAGDSGLALRSIGDVLTGIICYSSMALLELPETSRIRSEVEAVLTISRKAAGMHEADTEKLVKSFSHSLPVATVLIAAENPAVLDVCKRLLGRAGLKALVAKDGAEALRLIKDGPGQVALALVDAGLLAPEGGRPLYEALGSGWKERIILLAGAGGEGVEKANGEAGPYAVLVKPFDPEKLYCTVHDVLRKSAGGRGSVMQARQRPRVLVVDDEELILRALERAMRRDADVIGLPAAERAMEHLKSDSDFDWIISDLNMPGMSGLDFFRKLQELNPGLAERFVLLSGGAVDQDQAQAVHSLRIPVFEKPINFEELKAQIKKVR